jgi:ATP-dependent 26S proteasome regulatory subunit
MAGQYVIFHGYDGRDYSAYVAKVARGVATVTYAVFHRSLNGEMVTAYVSDPARIVTR